MSDKDTRAYRRGTFPREVTHEAARQAAQNFIDQHFRNREGRGVLTSIPAGADDDDVTLMDYIRQQQALAALAPTTQPEGNE